MIISRIHRCPYCGEELIIRKKLIRKFLMTSPYKCPYCQKRYVLDPQKSLVAYIPIGVYYLLYINMNLRYNKFANGFALMLVFIFTFIFIWFTPLRKSDFFEPSTSCAWNYDVSCSIKWDEKYRITRYFLFYSGSILPVCFFVDDNTATSLVWCAVFNKMRHFRKKSTCEFEFVLEAAPIDLLKKENRFKIFYKKKTIGIGTITKVEFLGPYNVD